MANTQSTSLFDRRIVRNEDLARIARKLTGWKAVSPYLGLSSAQEEAIEDDNRRTEDQRFVYEIEVELVWVEGLKINVWLSN